MALDGGLKELRVGSKYFKVGAKAAFAKGWSYADIHTIYEHLLGVIVELGASFVRIAYYDGEVFGPSPENAYPIHDYKNNKEASTLLSLEE